MAALNAMRTMFQRIGFSLTASQVIVDEQGLDSVEEIKLLRLFLTVNRNHDINKNINVFMSSFL